MNRGKRVKPISDRRRADLARRDEVRAIVHERDRYCVAERIVPEVKCGGPLDVDEIVLRSGDSTAWLDPDKCQLLCRRHHDWKHANPALAVERGLRRWAHRA